MFHFSRWGQMKDMIVQCSIETPLNNVLWYPCCKLVANKFVYNVLNMLLHILPAFVIDIFLKLLGSKPM